MSMESIASSRRILAAERRKKAMDMRRDGASYEDIAAALGIAKSTAHKTVTKGLIKTRQDTSEMADEVRTLELLRLDEYHEKLRPKVEKGDVQAIMACIKIQDRRSKYLGLDAPTEIKQEGIIELIVTYGEADPS